MGFITLDLLDIIDILLVSWIMYQLYKLVRGSSAYFIFMGIFAIYIIWVIVRVLDMGLISSILGQVLGVGVIALIVVFQQEIRRFLLFIGNKYFAKRMNFTKSTNSVVVIEELVSACENMSESLTGALIVISRSTDLGFVEDTGDKIDAVVNRRLIENIFFKNSPLHDGAIIINNNRISSVRCVLPGTENQLVPAYFGMRHRAAIGMTENSDAIVVVVSEQSGKISFVVGGRIERGISLIKLKEHLMKNLTN